MPQNSDTVMKYFLILLLLHFTIRSCCQLPSFQCGDKILDQRDGQSYATVLIGTQCWMQHNMNIGKTVQNLEQTDNNRIEKTCYGNEEKWCSILGGLYTWNEAMQYKSDLQGICPKGWHIPSRSDWEILITFLGPEDAGQKMKVSKAEFALTWDGNDVSGFMALPAGAGNNDHFKRIKQWTLFWSSTSENDQRAWFTQLDSYWYPEPPKYKSLYLGNYYLKSNGFSIRCLKDE
jgi:uncharacterized protein (TIGR02145 family)